MEYKVGDEVLVKAKIESLFNENLYFAKCSVSSFYVTEEDMESPMTAEEAWEIVKRLFLNKCDGIENAFSDKELEEIFETRDLAEIVNNNTPQQAKAKIEAWEHEKKIEVGDVVDHNGEIGIVTNTDDEEGFYNVLYSNGSTSAHDHRNLKKTGRHIDITGLLEQIGGDE